MLISISILFVHLFLVEVSNNGTGSSRFVRQLSGENIRQGSVHMFERGLCSVEPGPVKTNKYYTLSWRKRTSYIT
jgi:ABC-type hemin transport system ATPase subunit